MLVQFLPPIYLHTSRQFKLATMLFAPEDSSYAETSDHALPKNERHLFTQHPQKGLNYLRGQGAALAHGFYTRASGYSVWPTAGFIGVDLP